MPRKIFLYISILIVFATLVIAFDLPAMAAPSDQEANPPERLRPDQYSYHGVEEIPFQKSSTAPEVLTSPLLAPIEDWSSMTFQSYVDYNWEIYWGDGDLSVMARLTNSEESYDIHPRLNRGSTRIAFASDRNSYIFEIFSMNVDGTDIRQLTNNDTDDVKPAWSPDGTHIAFQTYRDGNAEVYVMHADGSGQINLTHSGDYDGEPIWSPDGTQIAFISRRTNFYHVWVMNADGSNPIELNGQRYSENPVWSPDGTQIGYDADSDLDGWQELWSMNSDGSDQVLRASPFENSHFWANSWSPDAEWLVYTVVRMIYYNGHWYWNDSYIHKINEAGWKSIVLNDYYPWALDWSTDDILPPTSTMNSVSPVVPYKFSVSWSGQDNLAGILNYDVQYMDGPGGTWTNWQMGTGATSATFTGVGGHSYYFRLRAQDKSLNIGSWPANWQVFTQVETIPPFTRVNRLEPLTRGNLISLSWAGEDIAGSGIASYDIQAMDAAASVWESWLTDTVLTRSDFTGELGHTYYFRSSGMDKALNVEAWPEGEGDTKTSFYSWRTIGMISDNTGIPIQGADAVVEPAAFITIPSDRNGFFSAYMGDNLPNKTVSWSKEGYGNLPQTGFGEPDGIVDVNLPPLDNQVMDWGFEGGTLPGAWQAGGAFTPTLEGDLNHSGDYAASLGVLPPLNEPLQLGKLSEPGLTYQPFALDSLGGLHIAWPDSNNGYHIQYAYRSPTGAWSPVEIVTQQPEQFSTVRIVVDSDQNVHMLYTFSYASTRIYYTWRNINGIWSTPQQMASGNRPEDLVIDDTNRIHALIWADNNLVYSFHDPGAGWEFEPVPGTEWITMPAMEVDRQGQVVLVWTFNNTDNKTSGVVYSVRRLDGTWSPPVVLAETAEYVEIDIILDSVGRLNVVWSIWDDGLFHTRLELDGNWKPIFNFSGGHYVHFIDLVMDNQDNLTVVWSDYHPYSSQKDQHDNWSVAQEIQHPAEIVGEVRAAGSGGDVFVVWSQEDSSFKTDLYYALRHAGKWRETIRLTDTPLYSRLPFIIVDRMGGVNIAWNETDFEENSTFHFFSSQSLEQSGDAWISQALTVPVSMTNPTLSFLATLSGVSEISGNEFSLQVSTDEITTTLFTSTIPTTWEHFWFDMTPWSGQQITLTLRLTEHAGFTPASALLDEITLGTAHPDVWVEISGEPPVARPGDPFTYLVEFGNRGNIPASGVVISMTLPVGLSFVYSTIMPEILGSQLFWQVGDIPAGSGSDTIFVSVQVDASAPLFQTAVTDVVISTSSPELEVMNNIDHAGTYLGILQHLPILRR